MPPFVEFISNQADEALQSAVTGTRVFGLTYRYATTVHTSDRPPDCVFGGLHWTWLGTRRPVDDNVGAENRHSTFDMSVGETSCSWQL